MRIACDDCAVEDAVIDHLDLTRPQVQLKRLCRRCAEYERLVWAAQRAQAPFGARSQAPSPGSQSVA